ncbi:hypothetical protein M419DRAFT_120683 [Trichoderma reesei RUT C-30]|uniref:Uncharacterized protein n=1 Tax=Hypocrea jecorina (strain ATCC 56765 / BCRC 32924 / NRRL 11460 / Rut C-30) TaxID=1344414 RepID=A0A024RZA5_HYPJR|nr:hypothetical protein M419DRAFT_120683 [Trichoderma reesei RUT C-30]
MKHQTAGAESNIRGRPTAPAMGVPELGGTAWYRFRELRIQPATGSGGLHSARVR